MELDQIPGLLEAVAAAEEQEQDLRDVAFLDVPAEICGIACQQFRPRHYQHLRIARSPFIRGGRVSMVDVLKFLWVVSPVYRMGDPDLARSYTAAIIPQLPPLPELRQAIHAYLDEAWMDVRPPGASDTSPIACVAAHLVHEFGTAYHWPQEQTLETPFAALYQLQRLQDRDHAASQGRRMAFTNALSSAVRRAHIRRWRAAQKAEATS